MILLRAYLLIGLVAHKLIWERLKRRGGTAPPAPRLLRVRMAKALKTLVLATILVQTGLPGYWLPISASPVVIIGVGTVIYTLGLALALAGRLQLGDNWSDIETAQALPHQSVVQGGVYRYIRHPIYVGDLLLLLGLELALNSWLVLGVALLTPFVLARAIYEEGRLTKRLDGYSEYCRTTKRFIPFVV